MLEVVQVDRILAIEGDGFTARAVTGPFDNLTDFCPVAFRESVVPRLSGEDVDSTVLYHFVVEERLRGSSRHKDEDGQHSSRDQIVPVSALSEHRSP